MKLNPFTPWLVPGLRRICSLVEKTPALRLGPKALENASVALAKVMPWHLFAQHLALDANAVRLGADGKAYLHVWMRSNGQYRNELLPMTVHPHACWAPWERVHENWCCDIGEIHGLSASKAPLYRYSSLSQMICSERPDLACECTDQALDRLLVNLGMQFDRPQAGDYFVQHAWDGELTYVVNEDGSHRLAGAQRLAARLGRKVQLQGRLVSRYIDPVFMQAVLAQFNLFLVPSDAFWPSGLIQAIEQTGATYATSRMPAPLDSHAPDLQCATIVWMPKAQRRSQLVSNTFSEAGVLDLNRYISQLLHAQAAL